MENEHGLRPHERPASLSGYENQTEGKREDTLQAIRQGLADVEAGMVRPALRGFRQRIPQESGAPAPNRCLLNLTEPSKNCAFTPPEWNEPAAPRWSPRRDLCVNAV